MRFPMPAPADYCHLRVHSEFTIVNSTLRIDAAVDRAADTGMPALALTDLNNTFGMVKFYKAARASGVKPIVGCDVTFVDPINPAGQSQLLVLCQNLEGYRNLSLLLSRAYQSSEARTGCWQREWLTPESTKGLLALSGGVDGDVGQALMADHYARAIGLAMQWSAIFPGAFYVEVQRAGRPDDERYVTQALSLAHECGLPVVATHPVQFLSRDDHKAHEARVCIASGTTLQHARRHSVFTAEQYFKTAQEMADLFTDLPEALTNAAAIARRCNLTLELGKSKLPDFPTPNGESLDLYLRHAAMEGLTARLDAAFASPTERAGHEHEYLSRLEFEASTIVQMGFSGYFLIVADFINWAKENGIPVGPGRGSGAGSLVAYSLGITDLDPLRYDLLFERFLNPERVSMPDFDIDFCQDGRERVIDYVKQRYGEDSVSQIVTFGTMAAKAVVRDVGRVLDLPYGFVDQIAKLIPNELGMTLAKARQMEPQLNGRAEREEEVAELLALAERLEGLTRNVGVHAGGVLIAPGKLTDFCPLYCAEGSQAVVSQLDKDDVEQIGLVKFDFLGLRTLTVIDLALQYINETSAKACDLPISHAALSDPKAYAILRDCNTTAVFQLESRGMKDLVRRLQPDCFDDIVALVALFRPGPLGSGMVDDFINRKHGRARVESLHPQLDPILKPTYGVIVYQEQVMQIAQILGGYTLGSADLLRRAMGKKKPEEMAKHRGIFVKGAVERGVASEDAEYLFDLMEKFAEYGFNKSHSAAYALIAYQTAYLKAYHLAAFMAATLSAEMADTDRVRVLYLDCVANGLKVLPPDVNISHYRFKPERLSNGQEAIRYGLGAIKGTGESAIAAVVKAREAGGRFVDMFDFCARIDRRCVNRRVVEMLVRAGAFDGISQNRAEQHAHVSLALSFAEQTQSASGQSALFDATAAPARPSCPLPAAWSKGQALIEEKSALGFYLSGHPYEDYSGEVSQIVTMRLNALSAHREIVRLAGIVTSVRSQITRRGKMAYATLEDTTAQVDVAVFSELYERRRVFLKEDALVIVEGKVTLDDYTGGYRVTAEDLYDLDTARQRFAKEIRLKCNGNSNTRLLLESLHPYSQGDCAITLIYDNGTAGCRIALGKNWRVTPSQNFLDAMQTTAVIQDIDIVYTPTASI